MFSIGIEKISTTKYETFRKYNKRFKSDHNNNSVNKSVVIVIAMKELEWNYKARV
jgi:hypothetical protein